MMAAYPRYLFDDSFGTRAATLAAPEMAEPVDPLDHPQHSERMLQAALAGVRNEAMADGLLQGRREGEAMARQRIEADIADALGGLSGQLAASDSHQAAMMERIEAQGAALMVALVRRLTPGLLETVGRVEVERVAADALRAAGASPVLRLRAHPSLSGPLGEYLAALAAGIGFRGRLDIVPDETLNRGALDATWESGGVRRDPAALERAVADLTDRALAMISTAGAPPDDTPAISPLADHSLGDRDAQHDDLNKGKNASCHD